MVDLPYMITDRAIEYIRKVVNRQTTLRQKNYTPCILLGHIEGLDINQNLRVFISLYDEEEVLQMKDEYEPPFDYKGISIFNGVTADEMYYVSGKSIDFNGSDLVITK